MSLGHCATIVGGHCAGHCAMLHCELFERENQSLVVVVRMSQLSDPSCVLEVQAAGEVRYLAAITSSSNEKVYSKINFTFSFCDFTNYNKERIT